MLRKLALFAVVLGGLAVWTGYSLFQYQLQLPLKLDEAQLIEVKSGASIHSFSKQIVNAGFLENRFWLRNYVRLNKQYAQLKAGVYQLTPGMSPLALLKMINQGKEHQFTIQFIEGTTFKQWLRLLKDQPYIKSTLANKSIAEIAQLLGVSQLNPEGWFYPDTYLYTANTSDMAILKRAHAKMKQELEQLWNTRAPGLPYDNRYQALIMASIVEKESGKVVEQPIIASVFVNRLNKKMRLQTDPTVIYGLGDRYQGDIKRSHLREKTLYNTYRINGMPPTPIAMPSKTAIKAVLNPATSDFYYFVGKGDGFHKFSKNLAEHNKAVVRYQLNNG